MKLCGWHKMDRDELFEQLETSYLWGAAEAVFYGARDFSFEIAAGSSFVAFRYQPPVHNTIPHGVYEAQWLFVERVTQLIGPYAADVYLSIHNESSGVVVALHEARLTSVPGLSPFIAVRDDLNDAVAHVSRVAVALEQAIMKRLPPSDDQKGDCP